jgi:thiol:disulfide interchange protein DsbD
MLTAGVAATFPLAACSKKPEAQASFAGQPAANTQNPIVWSIAPVAGPLRAGETTTVVISAKLQAGWHVYSITQPAGGPTATRITVPSDQPYALAGEPSPTVQPQVTYDDAFRMNVQEHANAVSFNVPVRATANVAASGDSVRVNVRYQVCNASLCFPPQTARLVSAVGARAE